MNEQYKLLWESAQSILEKNLSPAIYSTFLQKSEAIMLSDNTLYVKVLNDFNRNYCTNNLSVISLNSVRSINKTIENVVFVTPAEAPAILAASEQKQEDLPADTHTKTFESFVVGNNNRFAHAAALSVAEAPSKSYNPLFIYGNSGVGKTHLMQAIFSKVKELHPSMNVLYVTAEEFTSDFVEAVRFNRDGDYRKNEHFKNKYRTVDMLLVDDIQFIAGKKETQEEFFNTFNVLKQASKQLVLTSDRHPREIQTLEKRIRSRFENGLICDIQPPDYETRLAILQEKATEMMISIDYNSLSLIAETYTSGDVRELEGILKKLSFTAQLSDKDIDVNFTHQCLGLEYNAPVSSNVTITKIKQTISDYFHIKQFDLESQQRKRTVAFPRQVAIYLAKKLLGWELVKISEEFGGRNHSTIIYSISQIEKIIATDPQKKLIVEEVEDLITKG